MIESKFGFKLRAQVGLNTRQFQVSIEKNKLNTMPPFVITSWAWNKVAHIHNLLNGEPVFSYENRPLLNIIPIDDTLKKRVAKDLAFLNTEILEEYGPRIALQRWSQILSEVHAQKTLTDTPAAESIVSNESTQLQKYEKTWRESTRQLEDAWDILELNIHLTQIAATINTPYAASLARKAEDLEKNILQSPTSKPTQYPKYKKHLTEANFTTDHEEYYRQVKNLILQAPEEHVLNQCNTHVFLMVKEHI